MLYLEVFIITKIKIQNKTIYNFKESSSKYNNKEVKNEINSNNSFNQKYLRKKKVGVIGLIHHKNIGNNLLKFAIYTQLKELGVEPYIIGTYSFNEDISFLNRTTNPRIIKSFNEIKRNDYDILMVNSDQTWRNWTYYSSLFYDIAFLNFSKNWPTPKFIYGASIGLDYWPFSNVTDKFAKFLLKNFTGISFREMNTIKYVKEHLEINATFVLDPTILIDKKYYIDIINNYKKKNKLSNVTEYILTYKLDKMKNMESFIRKAQDQLNYEILDIKISDKDYIENFLYGIYHCKAVITNSYHATIFSIIFHFFNKPFVVFLNSYRGNERFKTIKELYDIKDRFFEKLQKPNLNLLKTPLKINFTKINIYRNISLNYLKKNLNIT